ncbi:MAG: hypothetical protein HY316_06705 [Acidobacteria bacterium]|nr:hypothetical protein [Acidobacteriota bacterium]
MDTEPAHFSLTSGKRTSYGYWDYSFPLSKVRARVVQACDHPPFPHLEATHETEQHWARIVCEERHSRSSLNLFLHPVAADAQTFSTTGNMTTGRRSHTATLLPSGKVFLAGGFTPSGFLTNSAEFYDPATGSFSFTCTMTTERSDHTATLLPNGKVLTVGGFNFSSGLLSSGEIYDPGTGSCTATGNMTRARIRHTATLLPGGKVIIAGGIAPPTDTAELYDPATGNFTATGNMTTLRQWHTSTLLTSGKVLIAGGYPDVESAELYDPATGTWSPTGNMGTKRQFHTATLLQNGKVLITGGINVFGIPLNSPELYDPGTGTFTATGSMSTARGYHTATLLQNGKVLIAGGLSPSSLPLNSAELYHATTGIFSSEANMTADRILLTATLLTNGKVLIAGGLNSSGVLLSAELYNAILTLTVSIQIKPPATPPVPINLGSGGVVPVAILSSPTFDATTVNPTTVTLSGAAVALKGKGTPMTSVKDVNADGFPDLVVQVSTDALQLTDTAVEAVLTGQTFAGQQIQGSEAVVIVP